MIAAGCPSPLSPVPQGKTENTKDKKVTCVESEKGGRKKMGVERCPQRHTQRCAASRSGQGQQGREREHIQAGKASPKGKGRESPVQQLAAVVGHAGRPITTPVIIND